MKNKLFDKGISLVLVFVMLMGMTIGVSAEENADGNTNSVEVESNVEEKLSEDLINYIAITSSNQQLSDTQQVVVGIGNGDKKLKDGILTYKNNTTNEIYQVNRNDEDEDALSFIINYDNKSEGEYQLVGIEYVLDGEKTSIALADIDLAVTWGVGIEHKSDADVVIPIDDGKSDASDIDGVADVTFDVTTEDGKTATASSITEALQEVTGELSVESNGVVNTTSTLKKANEDVNVVSDTGLEASSNGIKNTTAGNVVVCLDPGHGGSESGACYGGLVEKDLNLRVAYYCKEALEQYGGVTVFMTRYDDSYVGLEQRTDIAKYFYNANVFVSLHMNKGGGNGVEVWYPNGNYNPTVGNIGYGLSEKILNNITALGLSNRGLKIRNSESGSTYPDGSIQDYYSVIHNSKRRGFAGIIVEHAFMDGDYGRLCDDNFLRQLGYADAKGIAEYYGLGLGEDLSQYEGAFYPAQYRYFNPELSYMSDQQLFDHWINQGVWNNRAGSAVFNLLDYANANPDLKNAYGLDLRAYARHFSRAGMKEGRTSISSFSVRSYKNRYPDLRAAYSDDLRKYYLHYMYYGIGEGRVTTGYDNTLVGAITTLCGTDYSNVYDYEYYKEHSPDVYRAYNGDDVKMLIHFVFFGRREGRQGKANFNVTGYKNRYLDLRRAYGDNLYAYYDHYMKYGIYEGRNGSYTPNVVTGEFSFLGFDMSPVYDFNYYQQHNPDIRTAYGNDDIKTLCHFVAHGIWEGRRASSNFDLWTYISRYSDLRAAYGWNLPAYVVHYIIAGRFEGRVAA